MRLLLLLGSEAAREGRKKQGAGGTGQNTPRAGSQCVCVCMCVCVCVCACMRACVSHVAVWEGWDSWVLHSKKEKGSPGCRALKQAHWVHIAMEGCRGRRAGHRLRVPGCLCQGMAGPASPCT